MGKSILLKRGINYGTASNNIKLFEISFDEDNLYSSLSKITSKYNCQIYISNKKSYLVISTKNLKAALENDISIKPIKELSYDDVVSVTNEIMFSNFTSEYNNPKILKYNINNISHNKMYYRIIKIKYLPENFNCFSKLKTLSDISIKFKALGKDESMQRMQTIKDILSAESTYHESRSNSVGYATCFPFLFKKELRSFNEIKAISILDVDIELLVSAESLSDLNIKTAEVHSIIEEVGGSSFIMTHFHSPKSLTEVLPLGYKTSEMSQVVISENKVNIIKPYRYYESMKNKYNSGVIKKSIKKNLFSMVTNKFSASIQKILPIKHLYENGLIETNQNLFSKIYSVGELNYLMARDEEKQSIFEVYKDSLNSFDSDIKFQVFASNEPIEIEQIKEDLLIKENDPAYKKYYAEYNYYIEKHIEETKNRTAKKNLFICISTESSCPEEASEKIDRASATVAKNLLKKRCNVSSISADNVVSILYSLINYEQLPKGNFYNQASLGDILSPSSIKFKSKSMQIEQHFKQVLYISSYPSSCKDTFFAELLSMPFSTAISMHITSVKPEDANDIANKQILSMNTNKYDYFRSKKEVSYDLKIKIEEAEALRDELVRKSQKMFFVGIYISVSASSQKELEARIDTVKKVANKYAFKFSTLVYRQLEGLFTTLPLGIDLIKEERTLLSDSTAVFIPFNYKSHYDKDGVFYGVDKEKHLLVVNRLDINVMKNPSGFILGVPGAGKSFFAKKETISYLLRDPNVDVLIIDPEAEYTDLVRELNGEIIKLSASSSNHINPFDISDLYGDDESPLKIKTEFLITLIEMLTGNMTPEEKTIVDRCIRTVYTNQCGARSFDAIPLSEMPDFRDLHQVLSEQPEQEAKGIALRLEIYAHGSLNLFAHKTNININNRIVCFNMLDLGKQITPPGMMITTDFIWNRLIKNRSLNKITVILLDEIYLMFANEQSADFVFRLYKRARKYGGVPTGITQNVSDLLKSHIGSSMIANAEFKIILDQAFTDSQKLQEILSLSDVQRSYITNADIGSGLLVVKGEIYPFTDLFPKDTELYRLMNTNLQEKRKELSNEKQV